MKKLVIIAISIFLLQSCNKEDIDALNEPILSESDDFVDNRDGNVYKTVKIGDQIWLAENLRYRLPKGSLDGCYTYGEPNIVTTQLSVDKTLFVDSINQIIAKGEVMNPLGVAASTYGYPLFWLTYANSYQPSVVLQQMRSFEEPYKVVLRVYNNVLELAPVLQAKVNLASADILNGNYSNNYGLMYTYDAAQKAIPDGWRLPTDEDWKILEGNMGMNAADIERLNAWRGNISDRFLGINNQDAGFNAQLAGARVYGSFAYGTPFINKDVAGYYWTSSMVQESDSTNLPIVRNFMKNQSGVWRGTSKESAAYHIRLIKNN